VEYSDAVASNVELARGSFDAFKRGDMDAYIDYFSEDVEWRVSAFLTGKDAYHGHDGIREFIADVTKLQEEHDEVFLPDYTEFVEVDENRVVALGDAEIKRQRDPLEFEVGLLYTFNDEGKISVLEGFTDRDEVRKAAGLD
jgi:ketosteroid isomerase-like protein